jgi:site-specific DNA-methyltransferase (adenine-specific)
LARIHETISIFTKKVGVLNKSKIPYIENKTLNNESLEQSINDLINCFRRSKNVEEAYYFIKEGIIKYESKQKSKWHVTKKNCKTRHPSRQIQPLLSLINGITERSIMSVSRDVLHSIHPTQKPVDLLERLLRVVSKEGDIVLDPFAGSASTAIACIKQNRNFICCEIDKEYYEAAIKRLNGTTLNLFGAL